VSIFITADVALAGDGYEGVAKDAVQKYGSKYLEKLKRAKECASKPDDCINSYEERTGNIKGAVNKMANVNECLTTTDPSIQKACFESAKAGYARRKQANQQAEATEAAKWVWDGQEGSEVRVCTRGKNKPIGIVLTVTNTRVKLEINKAGGNTFIYFAVGDTPWLDRGMVGC
jgi:hypothetical protein